MTLTIERTQGPAQQALALTDQEGRLLADAEREIEAGREDAWTAGLRIGAGLLEISRGRLYRAEYGSFEHYAKQRWNLDDRRARALRAVAEGLEEVKEILGDFSPVKVREAHIAPLSALPSKELRQAAFRAALERNGAQLTARDVKAQVKILLAEREPKALPLGGGATPTTHPLQQQHDRIKAQYPDALLLFKQGANYTLLGEDARRASVILQRSCDWDGTLSLPVKRSESFIARLIAAGERVAVCEDMAVEEVEADYAPCGTCGERHLESVGCKPAPVLNSSGALVCPQDAEGRYLDAAASSPVFSIPGTASPVECPQASPGGQEAASAPTGQSREGGGAKGEDFASSDGQFVDASTRVVSLEQTALLDAADLTVSDAVEIALRVHAAATAKGWSVERMLKTVERPGLK